MLWFRCAVRKKIGVPKPKRKASQVARGRATPRSNNRWNISTTVAAENGAMKNAEVTAVAAPKRRSSPCFLTNRKKARRSG